MKNPLRHQLYKNKWRDIFALSLLGMIFTALVIFPQGKEDALPLSHQIAFFSLVSGALATAAFFEVTSKIQEKANFLRNFWHSEKPYPHSGGRLSSFQLISLKLNGLNEEIVSLFSQNKIRDEWVLTL